MRILVISQYFYPENFRINDLVTALVKRGHQITVLTGLPNYPEGEIYEGYEEAYKTVTDYNGAKVYRCKLRPRHQGAKNLALNYCSFIREANKTLKNIKPEFDLVYFYEPSPISSGIPAIKYGKKHHLKTVIYNLDIWPDCVRDSRGGKVMSKANPVYLISKIISRHVYKNFDLILNKCDEFGEYLSSIFKIPEKKMVTLNEQAEDIYLKVNEKPVENGIIDFMFIGNIGKSQNCDQIVNAFSQLKNENIRLHFVGDGSYLEKLKSLVTSLKMDNKVVFHGRKTIDEVIDYYNLADVCLLSLSNATVSGLTPPTKLASYLASCRPVVASINGAGKRIIEEANCGFVCSADDERGLVKAMEKAIDNYEDLAQYGVNGRNYFLKKFTMERHIQELEKHLNKLRGQHE